MIKKSAFPNATTIHKNEQTAHVSAKTSVILPVMPKRMFVTMEHVNPSIQRHAWANSARIYRHTATKPVTGITARLAMDVIWATVLKVLHPNAVKVCAATTEHANARAARGYHAVLWSRV